MNVIAFFVLLMFDTVMWLHNLKLILGMYNG